MTSVESSLQLATTIRNLWEHPNLQPGTNRLIRPSRSLVLPRLASLPGTTLAAQKPHQLDIARLLVELEQRGEARTLVLSEPERIAAPNRQAGSLALRLLMNRYPDMQDAPAMSPPWGRMDVISAQSPEGQLIEAYDSRRAAMIVFHSNPAFYPQPPREFEEYGETFQAIAQGVLNLADALPAAD